MPKIIQGGMGVGVSGWQLARSVSECGQLGVVSGTALDTILARRLQMGDVGGSVRRALDAFPVKDVAEKILKKYFRPEGESLDKPFKGTGGLGLKPSNDQIDLVVAANFVEVYLAKEGHEGKVGINYLEKIQFPTLPSLFGAMLAGVDAVLMGAGIPKMIPGILNRLFNWEAVDLLINVSSSTGEKSGATDHEMEFDPALWMREHMPTVELPKLKRPDFYAIISSNILAISLLKRATGKIDGFIVEDHAAGGHNAPPRGKSGAYGDKDKVDLEKLKQLGVPFWLAGGRGTSEGYRDALAKGASGVQIGTAFAFCSESGFDPSLKKSVIEQINTGKAEVVTDALCSPTGFPFKILKMPGTLSDEDVAAKRDRRTCDLCYLREAYEKEDGNVGYRCPAEPAEHYLKKGGLEANLEGRMCLCNGLMSAIGLGQLLKSGMREPPLVTCGDGVAEIARYADGEQMSYSAKDVVSDILSAN